MIADLARAAERHEAGAVDRLRAAIAVELDRTGTAAGLLDAFELLPGVRAAMVDRIRVDERFVSDRWLLAGVLVPVFMATAHYEARGLALNAGRAAASTAA